MIPSKPLIQVFLLTHNRPDYILQTLSSILNQNFTDYEIIVSDNSTDNKTEILLQNLSDHRLKYLRRSPNLPALVHFNTVIKEVKSEYFMIFHDDDLMEAHCLEDLYNLINENSNIAAVGGNASVFWNKRTIRTGKFISQKGPFTTISTPEKLANIYLTFDDLAPFPSYLYRTRLVKNIELNNAEGGKHADVSFLLKILKKGIIKWTHRCIMRYRKHGSQGSQDSDIEDSKKLIKYICETTAIDKKSREIRYYRHKSWAGKLKGEFFKHRGRIKSKRSYKIYCAIFRFSPFDIFFKLLCWQIYTILKKPI